MTNWQAMKIFDAYYTQGKNVCYSVVKEAVTLLGIHKVENSRRRSLKTGTTYPEGPRAVPIADTDTVRTRP